MRPALHRPRPPPANANPAVARSGPLLRRPCQAIAWPATCDHSCHGGLRGSGPTALCSPGTSGEPKLSPCTGHRLQVSIGPARAGQGLISTSRYCARWSQQTGRYCPVTPGHHGVVHVVLRLHGVTYLPKPGRAEHSGKGSGQAGIARKASRTAGCNGRASASRTPTISHFRQLA